MPSRPLQADLDMKTLLLILCFILLPVFPSCAQADLSVSKDDVYIEQKGDDGYHLYVRKKPDIRSVLLAESTGDPEKKVASYALRSETYNTTNGDERRLLDGKYLDKNSWSGARYSIVDSTPEKNDRFTLAFHLFLPFVVIYGDPSLPRYGREEIKDGMFLNIISFEKEFADYTGAFKENPFRVSISQRQISTPQETSYLPKTMEDFESIAKEGGGKSIMSSKEELIKQIGSILDEATGKSLDLALSVDSTKSMEDDIAIVKKELVGLLKERAAKFEKFRIGLVVYRDYLDEYLVKDFPFETDLDSVQKKIEGITVDGGRDVPEAVYEALYEAETAFSWESESRIIILVGDAPPHPIPRGKITKEMVYEKAAELGIKINTIILPQ